MYFRCLVIGLFALSRVQGNEATALIGAALAAAERHDSAEALRLFERAGEIKIRDAGLAQTIARHCSDLVLAQPDVPTKIRYARAALDYSQRAVALNPKDPVNVLSLAVCHGKLALYCGPPDKIRYAKLVREEAERAITMDPNYAWAHHVLGRWHCEMVQVSAAARFLAGVVFGDLPTPSLKEGIRELECAVRLEPDELNHWIELGFALHLAGDESKARDLWIHALAMPSRGPNDEPAKQRARAELTKTTGAG